MFDIFVKCRGCGWKYELYRYQDNNGKCPHCGYDVCKYGEDDVDGGVIDGNEEYYDN